MEFICLTFWTKLFLAIYHAKDPLAKKFGNSYFRQFTNDFLFKDSISLESSASFSTLQLLIYGIVLK